MRRLFLLLLPWLLIAGDPDIKLLRLEAGLFAKMVFLDYEAESKLVDGKVRFVILYDTPAHRRIAESFVKVLRNRKAMGKELEAVAVSADFQAFEIPATAYIAILKRENLQKHLSTIDGSHRLLFVYDERMIEYGMIAVSIDVSVVPVINPRRIRAAGIELRPIIFKVAKVYDDAD